MEELLEYIEGLKKNCDSIAGSSDFKNGFRSCLSALEDKTKKILWSGCRPLPQREDRTMDDPARVEGCENVIEQ